MNSLIELINRFAGSREWWSSGLAARMRTGVALNLVGAAFNQGSTLVVNIVVANLLGRQAFGEYTMVLATVSTLATLGQLSMGYTATKHVAEFRSSDPDRASRIMGLCAVLSTAAAGIVALALALPAEWLADTVLKAPHLATELRVAAGAVFCLIIVGFGTGSLAGLEGYSALARAGVASGTLYAMVCSGLAWGYGLRGAIAGVAVSALLQAVILGVLLVREASRQGIFISRRRLWQERAIVFNFAVPASLTGFVTLPALWIASALLARQPGGYHQLALFGAANSFRTMVLFLPQTINNVGMSLLNNQRRSTDQAFRRVFWMNATLTTVTAAGGAVAILLAGSPLLRLFGGTFVEGRLVLMILLVPAIIEAVALALYQIIVSRGRMWTSLLQVSLPRDGAIVLFAAALTPAFGAAGLATSYALGWVLGLAGIVAIVSRLGLSAAPDPAVVSAR